MKEKRLEFLKTVCEYINTDLKFAENKNTFLTSFNLAVIAAAVSFLSYVDNVSCVARVFFMSFLGCIILSTIISSYSYLPLNKSDRLFKRDPSQIKVTDLMFYKHNFRKYEWDSIGYLKCEDDVKTMFPNENGDVISLDSFEKQLVYQIVDLSHIANTKFSLFSIALAIEIIGLLLLMLFLKFAYF